MVRHWRISGEAWSAMKNLHEFVVSQNKKKVVANANPFV